MQRQRALAEGKHHGVVGQGPVRRVLGGPTAPRLRVGAGDALTLCQAGPVSRPIVAPHTQEDVLYTSDQDALVETWQGDDLLCHPKATKRRVQPEVRFGFQPVREEVDLALSFHHLARKRLSRDDDATTFLTEEQPRSCIAPGQSHTPARNAAAASRTLQGPFLDSESSSKRPVDRLPSLHILEEAWCSLPGLNSAALPSTLPLLPPFSPGPIHPRSLPALSNTFLKRRRNRTGDQSPEDPKPSALRNEST